MRVIGISGMNKTVDFKRRELPDLDSRSYRIVQGLDAAAALVTDDGVVAAAAEERFTGEKTTGDFPVNAIRYCLDATGLTMADIDLVAHSFDYGDAGNAHLNEYAAKLHREIYAPRVVRALLAEHWPETQARDMFTPIRHHLAHAASSYHLSGFDDALVLVADGMGEAESMTVFSGHNETLKTLHTVPALHSLGTLYGVVTLYLGFEFAMDEYKVMGLAPYGDPGVYGAEMRELVRPAGNGGCVVPLLAENRSAVERETHSGALRALARSFGPPRGPGEPIEQHHMDVAAAAQSALEGCLLHTLRHFQAATGHRNLCLAGGVALNCTANGVIARTGIFDDIFVQPASGDDGSALGAALHAHAQATGAGPSSGMFMPYWGPHYPEREYEEAVAREPAVVAQRYVHDDLVRRVARSLANGDIVAWMQGRMEFGPRALGNRSILADPGDPDMRDRLNAVVKQREGFRPFAPVVTEEDADTYFELPLPAKRYAHMLFVVRTRAEWRDRLPAVTHVDGTARVQVIRRSDNERLWLLLKAFSEITGVPVLLNTSFNLRGQPVVRDPETALRTFLKSEIDYLVMGRDIIGRAGEGVRATEADGGVDA
ncbi:carbamoyltransferase [Spinactinospora alkalitolerans]|uniref:Carbamoyltransferase n=1 Tax=Spinactinospora alkalitolerans TaxID=687207 RepID=A0A852TWA6_9ACTN|nr:carbamoyltransferase C-terminal domain-containing protein [Spinactinospora alkalitolerans]NYE48011.1 carbamoyltransferase [Spinactinospora alkalitolerans]